MYLHEVNALFILRDTMPFYSNLFHDSPSFSAGVSGVMRPVLSYLQGRQQGESDGGSGVDQWHVLDLGDRTP